MRNVRVRDTYAEVRLRKELHRRGLRYQVNIQPLDDLRRKADVVFRRARVAVFVDGCFWHFCPQHRSLPKTNAEWWRGKLEGNRNRDIDTTLQLENAGWAVMRVWEHEDSSQAVDRIEVLVRSRTSLDRSL